jgi:hypothetical protein
MWWTVSEHLFQFCLLVTIILSSQAMSRRAQSDRLRSDGSRLRVALTIGLQSLRKLYEDNVDILSGGELPLISGRNQINLLRTQLGRLTTLHAPEIEAVMSANIAVERVETEMAIAGRKIEGVAFAIPAKDEARANLLLMLRETCSMLAAAEDLLKSDEIPGRQVTSTLPPFQKSAADEARRLASGPDISSLAQRNQPRLEAAKLG